MQHVLNMTGLEAKMPFDYAGRDGIAYGAWYNEEMEDPSDRGLVSVR